MNIALGTVIILLLVTPGILFRTAYLNGPYSRKNFKSSPVDEIFVAIIPAILFQNLAILLAENLTSYRVRLDVLYYLLTGATYAGNKPVIDFDLLREHIAPFITYQGVLFGFAFLLGYLARRLVRTLRLDLRYSFLRFNNEWYYLFSGEILDFPNRMGEAKAVEFIQVDALVKTSGDDVLYSGFLQDYFLSADSGLNRLYLTSVYRRRLQNDLPKDTPVTDKDFDERYYRMPGDLFVLTYEQIVNLNVTYYRLTETGVPETTLPDGNPS